jgi:two-component system response regulator FixJ
MAAEATIYLVDDDEAVRESVHLLLEATGYRVESHASPIDFLALPSLRPEACLIVDVYMPEMDGLALQAELNRRNERIPVIVMTGHADVPLAIRAMKAGALDFLEKPFERNALIAAVERALDRARLEGAKTRDAGQIAARIASLTSRERQVFELLIAGLQNKAIARELKNSPRTVEIHRARVMSKMNAASLQDLVRMAIQAGYGIGD